MTLLQNLNSLGSLLKHTFDPASSKSFKRVNKKVIDLSPVAVLLAPLFYTETVKVINKYNC